MNNHPKKDKYMKEKSVWNSSFLKGLRWILFIPIILLVLILMDIGLTYLTSQLFVFDWNFWSVLIFMVIFGNIIIFLPRLFAMILTALTVFICPNRKIGGYIFLILAIINFIYLGYSFWSIDLVFTGKIIVTLVLATIAIIITALSTIETALDFVDI